MKEWGNFLYWGVVIVGIIVVAFMATLGAEIFWEGLTFAQLHRDTRLALIVINSLGAFAVISFLGQRRESGFKVYLRLPFIFLAGLLLVAIFNLLLIDLGHFFLGKSATISEETRGILTKIYIGAFAILGFGVTTFVAWTRQKTLEVSQEQLASTSRQLQLNYEQFLYSQKYNVEKGIQTQYERGIEFLADSRETVQLSGLSMLWRIFHRASIIIADNPPGEILGENFINISEEMAIIEHSLDALHSLLTFLEIETNNINYLSQYYPSILKEKYPKKYKEIFGNYQPHIRESEENPSPIVQRLLFMLFSNLGGDSECIKSILLYFDEPIHLNGANFKGANVSELVFSNIVFENCNFSECQIRDSYFFNTEFKGCNIDNSSFVRSFFKETIFSYQTPKNVLFEQCVLNSTATLEHEFQESVFRKTIFSVKEQHIERLRTSTGLNFQTLIYCDNTKIIDCGFQRKSSD